MKVLTVVLSLLILLGTSVPCLDESECQDHESTEHHEDAGHEESSSCSPFCICQCCYQHIVQDHGLSFLTSDYVLDGLDQTYSLLIDNLPYSIWNPPRLMG